MTRITGFDPGYTKCGISQIEVYEDGIFVERAGVIFPKWAAESKSLEKVDAMIAGIEDFKKDFPEFFTCDMMVVEGQEHYGRRPGMKGANANVLIRMGKVSGAFYAMVNAKERTFVLPKVWNGSRSKEQNHPRIFSHLENPEPADWPWVHKVTPSNFEHAIDSVGMAVWLYKTKQGESL